jgi:hypothetical protein
MFSVGSVPGQLENSWLLTTPEPIPRISLFDLGLLNKMISANQCNNISYSHSEMSDSASKMVRVV